MSKQQQSAAWFPAVRTGTGTDVFTVRLAATMAQAGLGTENFDIAMGGVPGRRYEADRTGISCVGYHGRVCGRANWFRRT